MKIKLDLSNHNSIPKIIHVAWKDRSILESESPLIKNGLINMKKLNPSYRFELSTDEDIEQYLNMNLKRWDYFKLKNKKIVEKVDLWRLLKMYLEGGIYIDIDRYCNISFDEIIEKETKCILPTTFNIDFSQDIMISCKGNPIFKKAIEYNLQERYLINPRGVFHLGPPIYMKAVTETVFGEKRKRNPGKSIMEEYRTELLNSKHFQTFYEQPPYDTLIFKMTENEQKLDYKVDKNQFYESQNIIPWNKGFDKNTAILIALVILLFIMILVLN